MVINFFILFNLVLSFLCFIILFFLHFSFSFKLNHSIEINFSSLTSFQIILRIISFNSLSFILRIRNFYFIVIPSMLRMIRIYFFTSKLINYFLNWISKYSNRFFHTVSMRGFLHTITSRSGRCACCFFFTLNITIINSFFSLFNQIFKGVLYIVKSLNFIYN